MISSRAVGAGVLGVVLAGSAAHGQAGAHYRDFQLGSDIASVAALTGLTASDVKIVHSRPAMLQELEWRRPYADSASDPVQRIAFSFYNDQLFRLVVDYDRDRTEGMTDADMIEAISTMYGAPVRTLAGATHGPSAIIDQEFGTRIAAWSTADYTAVLYLASYASGFKMVVTSFRLNALARTAAAQAIRLDEREAPKREGARQRQAAEDARAAKAKARLANKATFKP